MADIPNINDKFLSEFAQGMDRNSMGVEEVIKTMLSRVMSIAGDVSAEEFTKVWTTEVSKKMKSQGKIEVRVKAEINDYLKTRDKAEKLITQSTMTEEQQRLKNFKKNIDEQKAILEKYEKDTLAIIERRTIDTIEKERQIQKVKKETAEATQALERKEKMGGISGVPGGSELLGALKSSFQMLTIASVSLTAISQGLNYSKASAGLSAAKEQVFGGSRGGMPTSKEQAFGLAKDNMPTSKEQAFGLAKDNTPANMPTNMFAGMAPGLTDSVQRMQLMSQIFTDAPRLIGETSESTRKLVGYLGSFGLSIEESSKLLVDAQRGLGFSSEDLVNVFQLATSINRKYGISVSESAGIIREMTGSLRMMGLGAKEATAIMNAIPTSTSLGIVTPDEFKKYTSAISGFIGGMSPSQMGGIMSFMKGGGLPGSGQLLSGGKEMPGMVGQLYEKIRGGFGSNAENMKLYIAEGFTKGMGIQIPITLKTMETMDQILQNMPTNVDDVIKQLAEKDIKPMEDRVRQGMETLLAMNGGLSNIEKILMETLVPIAAVIDVLTLGLGKVLSMGGAGGTIGAFGIGAGVGARVGGVPGALIGGTLGAVGYGIGQVTDVTRSATPVTSR